MIKLYRTLNINSLIAIYTGQAERSCISDCYPWFLLSIQTLPCVDPCLSSSSASLLSHYKMFPASCPFHAAVRLTASFWQCHPRAKCLLTHYKKK